MQLEYYHQRVSVKVANELLNDLRLKKTPEMLESKGKCLAWPPKMNILTIALENCKNQL